MPGVPCLWKHPLPILRALKHCWKVGQKWSKGRGCLTSCLPQGQEGRGGGPAGSAFAARAVLAEYLGLTQTVPSRCRENLFWLLTQENSDSSWTQNNRPFGRAKITQEKAFRKSFMPHASADKAGLDWSQLKHTSRHVPGKSTEWERWAFLILSLHDTQSQIVYFWTAVWRD